MKEFARFFAIQFVMYGLITWNYRMVAQANYAGIGLSDGIIAYLNFSVIKKVGEAKSRHAHAGYVLGGIVGSVLAAYLTKLIYGQ